MEVFGRMLDNIRRAQEALPGIVYSVAAEHEAEIVDLNVEQLKKGQTNQGKPIKPSYRSNDYAQLKQSLGSQAPLGTPDLILEGDFTEAFYAEKRGEAILIDSTDPKSNDLQEKYDDVIGLGVKNRKEFTRDILYPGTIKKIENEITKGL